MTHNIPIILEEKKGTINIRAQSELIPKTTSFTSSILGSLRVQLPPTAKIHPISHYQPLTNVNGMLLQPIASNTKIEYKIPSFHLLCVSC